ncbi:DUF1768-domain-containing protein [Aureobasidium pullulans]|uniref:DUF1768-domain-containing protein n=1 Tax=Aureobasidium pullulans TaxID=5580 RepID=A0A4S8ZK89_AURPU|nr:DUF1768-domain-containing protein [Aureobasidium pullulans]THW07967.1 DUF1768-domain-containing protein [Aureobasidium pullulans]THW66391.1 DUF1768-domain-containing protein [Aureobasidium pullulans]THW72924.1 DUF1768-domain-containing protein [Aureobasidium pullulans]THY16181.1 DUF1768-domain-containing protein [Aureobasidium pullulans]
MRNNSQANKPRQAASTKQTKPEIRTDKAYAPMRTTAGDSIFFFKDDEQPYGFLCQWYRSRFKDPDSGLEFNCAEQWMMWNKAQLAGDATSARTIMATTSPRKQKQLGRDVEGFDVDAWDQIKLDVVQRGNYLKFTQATNVSSMKMDDVGEPLPLKDLLLATGEQELAEASRFDRVWGIGFDAQQAQTTSRDKWGQNLLGIALMNVRDKVRHEAEATCETSREN